MKRLILVGSPRTNGRSAHLAEMLFEANIDERPEDELFLVPVSEIDVGPCIGCNGCRERTPVVFKGENGEEETELKHRCVFDDDMQTLYDLLDDADELTVVSPVYFSGAPAPLKCVLDRMQPYFWVNQRGRFLVADQLEDAESEARRGALPQDGVSSTSDADATLAKKRPATLHVVGEGCDPHGFDALVSETRSALACAGFRLGRLFNWVGKIDESGEILAEAGEVQLPGASAQQIEETNSPEAESAPKADRPKAPNAGKPRPKLDLSSSQGRKDSAAQAQDRSSNASNASGKSKPSGKGKSSGAGQRANASTSKRGKSQKGRKRA